ncbi:MAG: T9SS type A sorting domain-containing protein [Bacteroidetes bacterium]|nr:T9SS type A sorting domain-containing protein [Bacteroidota bacterium]
MVKSSFDVIIKRSFLLLFLLFSCRLLAQPTLSLDWEYKEPIAQGSFVTHDNAGNIITIGLGGTNMFGTYVRLIVIKQDTAGNIIWKKVLGDVAGGLLRAKDYVIDSTDNIYITGRAHYNAQNAEGFTLKYDAAGNLVWRKYYGSAIGLVGEFNSITLYDNKYVYVTGEMDSINGQGARKAILAKYDSIGNLLWNKADSVGYNQEGKSVEVDKAGNAYVIGYTSCCLPGGKMFVEKYDSTGSQKWKTVIVDTAYQYGFANRSAIDDSANIYLAGHIQGLHITTGFDAGVSKIDSSGNIQWFYPFVSSLSNQVTESPKGILIDKQNGVIVYGNASGGFVLKLNTHGLQEWKILANGIGLNNNYVLVSASLNSRRETIVGGYGFLQNSPRNFFVHSIDSAGNTKEILGYSYQNNFNTSSFDLSEDSSFFLSGALSDTNFVVEDSLFILKLKKDEATYIVNNRSDLKIAIYPNPFKNQLNLNLASSNWQQPLVVNLFNSVGIKQCSVPIPPLKSNFSLNLESIPKGVYFAEVTSNNQVITRTKIIKM